MRSGDNLSFYSPFEFYLLFFYFFILSQHILHVFRLFFVLNVCEKIVWLHLYHFRIKYSLYCHLYGKVKKAQLAPKYSLSKVMKLEVKDVVFLSSWCSKHFRLRRWNDKTWKKREENPNRHFCYYCTMMIHAYKTHIFNYQIDSIYIIYGMIVTRLTIVISIIKNSCDLFDLCSIFFPLNWIFAIQAEQVKENRYRIYRITCLFLSRSVQCFDDLFLVILFAKINNKLIFNENVIKLIIYSLMFLICGLSLLLALIEIIKNYSILRLNARDLLHF